MKQKKLTTRDLIKQLLDMPMDSEIECDDDMCIGYRHELTMINYSPEQDKVFLTIKVDGSED